MAGLAEALEWAREQITSRVPKADLDQRDPDYIRDQLPGTWLLASLYFRADVQHLDRIPAEGPVLRKFGTVAANPENARLALESGAALLIYPGGDYEVFRPSWERHTVDFDGRMGYVKLAREAGVPIVPVASVGGQESALFLNRGQWLAKLLRADKILRLKSIPISLALPWGLNISDLAGHIPLPTKISIEVQHPIEVDGDDQAVHDKVMASLQAGVDRLAARRRFPVIG
jgi:1-acyl-sn-glycerol-3-phosphate acyltransferase